MREMRAREKPLVPRVCDHLSNVNLLFKLTDVLQTSNENTNENENIETAVRKRHLVTSLASSTFLNKKVTNSHA